MQKRFILSNLILILFLSACQTQTILETTETKKLPEVEVLQIEATQIHDFEVSGEVTAVQSARLTSELRGSIATIMVKPGDKVSKNQILVTLKSPSVSSALETAQETLSNSQNTLTQTSQSAQKNIQSAQKNLEIAQINLQNVLNQNQKQQKQAEEALSSTLLNLDLNIESAQTAFETAQINLEETRKVNQATENTYQSSLQNTISAADTTLQSSITTLDAILGLSNFYEDKNDIYEKNLGVLNFNTKIEAENSLRILMQNYTSTTDLQINLQNLQIAEEATQKTLNMLKNSSTGPNFSQNTLDGYINSIQGQLTAVRTTISSLTSAQNNYTQILDTNQAKLKAAEQQVKSAEKVLNTTKQDNKGNSQITLSAQAQYESTLAQLKTVADNARKQVEIAEIAYQNALTQANLTRTNAQAGVTQAEGNLEQAQINQAKLNIQAPFDGAIINVPVKVGDEINPGDLLAEIENDHSYKIIAYLTAKQVANLKTGDPVKIGTQNQSKISAISPTIDPVAKKYKVEIMYQDLSLHSGQIVKLQFKIDSQENTKNSGIYIPLVALHLKADTSFVWTVNTDNQTIKTPVETGELIGDKIEITSGLQTGDKVIVKGGRLFEQAGTEVSITNL